MKKILTEEENKNQKRKRGPEVGEMKSRDRQLFLPDSCFMIVELDVESGEVLCYAN